MPKKSTAKKNARGFTWAEGRLPGNRKRPLPVPPPPDIKLRRTPVKTFVGDTILYVEYGGIDRIHITGETETHWEGEAAMAGGCTCTIPKSASEYDSIFNLKNRWRAELWCRNKHMRIRYFNKGMFK